MHIKNHTAPYIRHILSCATLMSAKQAINVKLQDIVATYLRCRGVVNNQIRSDVLLSLSIIFLNR